MDAVYGQLTTYLGNITARTALTAGSFLLISAYLVNRLTKKTYKLPPGPRHWPIVGNLPNLFFSKNNHEYFDSLRKTHGDIYVVHIGSDPYVIINGIDLIREAFVQKGNDFAGRLSSYTIDLFSRNGKGVIFGSFGPVWRVQRKIMHGAMRKYASGEHLEEKLHDAMEVLSEYLTKNAEAGPVDLREATTLLVYNVICSITFGTSYKADDPEFLKISTSLDTLNELTGDGLAADYLPILRFVPTRAQRKLKRLMPIIQDFFRTKWNEHNKTYDADAVTDLIYHLIEQREELHHSKEDQGALAQMTEEHFLELINDFFTAGTDTSRYTLHWVILYMAAYPDIQRKMQDEIDSAVGAKIIKLSDKKSFPFTEAVLHEVMRIRTLVPLFLPHQTTCETSVGGYTLPPRTNVMANVLSLHWDPETFPEPHEFKPERFLDENGKFMVRPGEWMPFSTGRRVCVGEALAKVELLMLTAMIFQRFTFAPEDGKDVDLNYQNFASFLEPVVKKVKVNNRNESM